MGNFGRHGGPMVDGLNRRGRESIGVLHRAVLEARERKAAVFVVCGDLFHTARPEPAVIRAVQDVFKEADPMRVLLVPGNHDMPDATAANGNTAMAPLWIPGTVEVVRSPGWHAAPGVSVMAIPFDGTAPMSEHVAAVMERLAAETGYPAVGIKSSEGADPIKVAAIHVGLWDDADASPWQRAAKDGMEADALLNLMKQNGVDVALVGNYHTHRVWADGAAGDKSLKRLAYQVGTLCPASHGDYGLVDRGLVAFLEADGSVTKTEIPGPRFITEEDPSKVPGEAPEGFSYYVRLRGRAAAAVRAGEPFTQGWMSMEVDGDPEPSDGALADAAVGSHVETADTDEGAIEGFINGMVLPEGVDRERVRELALDCWKKA